MCYIYCSCLIVIRRTPYGKIKENPRQTDQNQLSTCKPKLQRYCFSNAIFRQEESALTLQCNEYQKLLDKKSLYSSSLQKIPAPNFIELYNGTDTLSDFSEHRLSSAFENLSGEPKLELIVTVLNINEGHNALLMEHCQTLKEYSQYVAKVRKYAAGMPLDQAVEYAVNECIKENILADFLRKNRAEVISMSIFEYDKEEEEKKLRKAEYEAGIQKGVLNTARHLLELNLLSLENISRATGLSIDELKKLQQ